MNRKKLKTVLSLFITVLIAQTNYAQTVTIGTQVWMTKNLNVDKFRNGDPIPEAKTYEEWTEATENREPAWCYYDNNPDNGDRYGKLYNWYAVHDPRGLAPEGWKIPSDDDWSRLTDFLGGKGVAGAKMKSKPKTKIRYVEEGGYDETKWVTCNNCKVASPEYKKICPSCKGIGGKEIKTGKYIPKTKRKVEDKIQFGVWAGTNESGFSGLPGGARGHYGGFSNIGKYGLWWSSTYKNTNTAWSRSLSYIGGDVFRGHGNLDYGFSVRCLRD